MVGLACVLKWQTLSYSPRSSSVFPQHLLIIPQQLLVYVFLDMARFSHYAVKVGLVPGVYEDWASCFAQVNPGSLVWVVLRPSYCLLSITVSSPFLTFPALCRLVDTLGQYFMAFGAMGRQSCGYRPLVVIAALVILTMLAVELVGLAICSLHLLRQEALGLALQAA